MLSSFPATKKASRSNLFQFNSVPSFLSPRPFTLNAMAAPSQTNGSVVPSVLQNAETLDGISMKSGWDGKASIEHQVRVLRPPLTFA